MVAKVGLGRHHTSGQVGQRRSAVEAGGSAVTWSPNLFVAWLIETLEAGSTSPLAAAGLEHTHVV